jgi:hypothetical protein
MFRPATNDQAVPQTFAEMLAVLAVDQPAAPVERGRSEEE